MLGVLTLFACLHYTMVRPSQTVKLALRLIRSRVSTADPVTSSALNAADFGYSPVTSSMPSKISARPMENPDKTEQIRLDNVHLRKHHIKRGVEDPVQTVGPHKPVQMELKVGADDLVASTR